MRESNFNFPAQNRACVCISQALYDRRAIDAPAPSLPLVNSLTHLSYLTATSPRIREILSVDGGLERLVRILKACASGGPPVIEETLSQLKGKGTTLAKGARKSPFKPFAEYTPTTDDLNEALSTLDNLSRSTVSRPLAPAPSSTSAKNKQLLFTYTLAFQCVVNIGVRGSETIRTRVVEAGALDVVVNVLERYLEEIARRKVIAEKDLASKRMAAIVAAPAPPPQFTTVDPGQPQVEVMLSMPLTRPSLAQLEVVNSSRTVSASSSAASLLAPPARVSTPDTVLSSMDEGDNGSSSGQEGDEVVLLLETSATVEQQERRVRSDSKRGGGQVDRDGDVVMEAEEAVVESTEVDETSGPAAPSRQRSNSRRQRHHHHHAAPAPSVPVAPAATEGLQYRDEDVLLSLQLLAYLSKYPHVRSVFHSPGEMHDDDDEEGEDDCHAHAHAPENTTSATPPSAGNDKRPTPTPTLSSSVFSLVEAFTHRPPTSDPFTPRHSNEVQYWAGVIMRNACRKDESRGGIRQCANMQCGVWEKYAREFAKCRRCRKAKYCSKGCQSSAWGRGHRYWCAKAAPKEAEVEGEGEAAEAARLRRRQRDEEEDDEVPQLPPPAASNSTTQAQHAAFAAHQAAMAARLAGGAPPAPGGGGGGGARARGLTPHRAHAGVPTVPGGPRINLEGFGGVDLTLGEGMGLEVMDEEQVAQEMMGGGVVFGVGEGEVNV